MAVRGRWSSMLDPDIMTSAASRPRLEVYVAPGCFGCEEARRLAGEAAARFPRLSVRVIDLAERSPPEPVAAVPTYVMDGVVIALGNPRPDELFARLEADR